MDTMLQLGTLKITACCHPSPIYTEVTIGNRRPTMLIHHSTTYPLILTTSLLLLSEFPILLRIHSSFDTFFDRHFAHFSKLADESKVPEMSKLEHAIAKRMGGVGIIICGLLLLAVALIMGTEFPKLVYQRRSLVDVCIVNTSHNLYETWVKDKWRDKYNRVYYWEITNADDFLYAGAAPQVLERGPYVYREHEEKHDVRFSLDSVDFYLRRWQVFSPQLTRSECGSNCSLHDQITLLNPHYFGQVGKYGGDVNYALLFVPETVDNAITDVTLLTNTNFTGVMAFFGKTIDSVLNPLITDLGYPVDFKNFSFATWLGQRDTIHKEIIYTQRGSQDFTVKEMAGLFGVIKNAALLGATQDLLSRTSYVTECDVNSNVPRLFTGQDLGAGVLQYESKPPACSFLACLSKYIALQRQIVQTRGEVPNVTDCIARYLCMNNATACFTLPVNPYYQDAYIFAIHEYITRHWTKYALYRRVHVLNQDLVVTRRQSELALGYYLVNETDYDGDIKEQFVPGILEHTDLAADVRWKSKKISLYNCFDATEASTNFFWKGYDGQLSVLEQQFPNASKLDRRIYSYRRNMPPIKELVACEDTLLKEESYFFFLPTFWRKFQFWPTGTAYIGEYIVSVITVNRSMFEADDIYVSEEGLQAMSRTFGFLSWLSLPHFLYAEDTGLVDEFNTSPREDKHNLQMSVEPVTGVVWESCIRYQLNVGLTSNYTSVSRPTPLQVPVRGRPLPVYWVDSYFLVNQAGHDWYAERTARLLKAACGGLIGMGTISGFFFLVGLMAATIRCRSGRVAPAEVVDVGL